MTQPAQEPSFRCLRCDTVLAAGTKKCPHCGQQTPTGKARRGNAAALLLGIPLVAGFFGIGWYINGGSFAWLTALHPVDKIACASAHAEQEAEKAFNDGPGKVRLLTMTGLSDAKETSRTRDELRCSAAGRFDDDVQRPVSYQFSAKDQQISLEVYVP